MEENKGEGNLDKNKQHKTQIILVIISLVSLILLFVSILFPMLKEGKIKQDQIIRIENEIKENYEKIKNIGDPQQKVVLPDGIEIQMLAANAAIAEHVKTEVWESLMPVISSELQEEYEKIYLYTRAISDDSNVPDQIKPLMLFDNAKSFIEEYHKLFWD